MVGWIREVCLPHVEKRIMQAGFNSFHTLYRTPSTSPSLSSWDTKVRILITRFLVCCHAFDRPLFLSAGSFTLFRDLFVKQIKNVDPATVGLYDKGSWSVSNSKEGVTVTTLGQRVIPETLKAYKEASILSNPPDGKLPAAGEYQPFKTQPTGRYYAV